MLKFKCAQMCCFSWSSRRPYWTVWFTYWVEVTFFQWSATSADVWRSSTQIFHSSDTLLQRWSAGHFLIMTSFCAWFSEVFLSLFHFGQVLDVITPPYTSDFVQLFLPILENDSIAGTIRTEGEHDPVAEFIGELSTVVFKTKNDLWDLNES